MSKAEYKKRGAPKGTITNPKGNNQYENIYADKPVCVNLLVEDDQKLARITASKPRGWKSTFIREAISIALNEVEE
ncbi:MAG: hypothetical protein HC836_30535 [Richelia sp. RM2_1_2]|nr:hypothetical protein [Richelia sp. RM2_1_2]